jgi:glycosyltransferase involved in cell wall biosynthesis
MPAITALLHARNDALCLGRALETLLPCDEIVVVDHGTHSATRRIAREYGARVVSANADITPGQCLPLARHDWILCLEPRESLTEALVASLFEWKAEWKPEAQSLREITAFAVLLREETPHGWQISPTSQTRLVPRSWNRWQGLLPATEPSAITLEGVLLRFIQP